jgi:hypothetical protein
VHEPFKAKEGLIMTRALILALALCAVASACSYREEKTVVPATTAATVAPVPTTVTHVDPAPSSTVVYTR